MNSTNTLRAKIAELSYLQRMVEEEIAENQLELDFTRVQSYLFFPVIQLDENIDLDYLVEPYQRQLEAKIESIQADEGRDYLDVLDDLISQKFELDACEPEKEDQRVRAELNKAVAAFNEQFKGEFEIINIDVEESSKAATRRWELSHDHKVD